MMDDLIRPPSDEDLVWLNRAEEYALRVLCDALGSVSLDRSEADLRLVQETVETGRIRSDQVLELQCLGVVLGNIFTSRTSMQWARVINEFGDLLAIHDAGSGFTLYPITMISKRVEDERPLDLVALYRSFVADLGLRTP